MASGFIIAPSSQRVAPKPTNLALRVSENFFQRWPLILLPIVLMSGIGVLMAQRITSDFPASATLSSATNPLVESPEVRGTSTRFLESPAAAASRIVNERLRTDQFADGVAERADLGAFIDSEQLTYDDLRRSVGAVPVGESLFEIRARWGDPDTSLRLVAAVIAEYSSVVEDTVTEDARTAVEFYEGLRDDAVADLDEAQQAFASYLESLPDRPAGVDPPLEVQVEIQRLTDRVSTSQTAVDQVEGAIESARLSVVRAQSEAGRNLEIIDPPSSSADPESRLTDRLVVLAAFVAFGTLVSLTILALSTYLDRSVRSAADIEAAGAGVTVAAVPRIDTLGPHRRGADALMERLRTLNLRRLLQRA